MIQQAQTKRSIPEPIETERKFLVNITGEIPNSREMDISQTYLVESDGTKSRIRMRGENGHYVYFHTIKKARSANQRIEVEHQITSSEYVELLNRAVRPR